MAVPYRWPRHGEGHREPAPWREHPLTRSDHALGTRSEIRQTTLAHSKCRVPVTQCSVSPHRRFPDG